MNISKHELVSEIADEIYHYLRAHPKSADTLEGVALWWLLHEQYLRELKLVEKALEILVNKGLVASNTNPDGTVIFSLAFSMDSSENKSNDDSK